MYLLLISPSKLLQAWPSFLMCTIQSNYHGFSTLSDWQYMATSLSGHCHSGPYVMSALQKSFPQASFSKISCQYCKVLANISKWFWCQRVGFWGQGIWDLRAKKETFQIHGHWPFGAEAWSDTYQHPISPLSWVGGTWGGKIVSLQRVLASLCRRSRSLS